jgi:hypothetical protein
MRQVPLCSRSPLRAASSLVVSRLKTHARRGAANPARPDTRKCTSLVSREVLVPGGFDEVRGFAGNPPGGDFEGDEAARFVPREAVPGLNLHPGEAAHKHMLRANADRAWSRTAHLVKPFLPLRCVGLIGDEVEDARGWTSNVDACLNGELPHNASFRSRYPSWTDQTSNTMLLLSKGSRHRPSGRRREPAIASHVTATGPHLRETAGRSNPSGEG